MVESNSTTNQVNHERAFYVQGWKAIALSTGKRGAYRQGMGLGIVLALLAGAFIWLTYVTLF